MKLVVVLLIGAAIGLWLASQMVEESSGYRLKIRMWLGWTVLLILGLLFQIYVLKV
jgi:hypothetical protein